MGNGNLVRFTNVSKTFRAGTSNHTVLDGVSLTVSEGEFVSIIGPSGSGKTTILNIMAGFTQPTKGIASFDGKPITKPGPERGVVFQEYSLFPWLTVLGNVEFGLRASGHSRRAARESANHYLSMVGLSDHGHKYPIQLSGGMRQRVGIARALATRPKLLLLDEPFAAVDALTRTGLQRQLLHLWEETGTTVVLITHSVEEALYLSQRVLVVQVGGEVSEFEISLPYPRDRVSVQMAELGETLLRKLDIDGSRSEVLAGDA